MSRILVVMIAILVLASVVTPAIGDTGGPFLWAYDSFLGATTDKAKIGKYLDTLKAHSVSGVWVPVEFCTEGTVNYKKTDSSGLSTAKAFTTGAWAHDDFLSYVIAEAHKRGMKVVVTLNGSNYAAWDEHPDWRKLDSKGNEVLVGGTLKSFCPNAPYWDKIFFPMVKEIAGGYDVDGVYFDTCQLAYGTDDACFCEACKARFKKETGWDIPLDPVSAANLSDQKVRLHALTRVEWISTILNSFAVAVKEANPHAEIMLNAGGLGNSYKNGISAARTSAYADLVTPEPFRFSQVFDSSAGSENDLANARILPYMTPYGYQELLTRVMGSSSQGKPVVAADAYTGGERSVEVQTGLIESAIGGGAKGYLFSGHFGHVITGAKTANAAIGDPKYIQYLKDLTAGTRSQWVADMRSDARVAILDDRAANFWTGEYWKRLKAVGGTFANQHLWRKTPLDIISTSEPARMGSDRYRLDVAALSGYDLIIAPGLEYASKEDLQTLREFAAKGGRLLLMGGIGTHGEFLGDPTTDDAYEILGITTEGAGEPSGFVVPGATHPVFTVPGGFAGPMGSFRISEDKNASLSFKPKYDEGWEVLATEVTDSGKRTSMLIKMGRDTNLGYLNSAMAGGYSPEMHRILANMAVVTTGRSTSLIPVGFSEEASINVFRSSDGLAKYIHIFTPNTESDTSLRIRADEDLSPVAAEVIMGGGSPKPISVVEANRDAETMEMTITSTGNGILKLGEIKPPYVMVKIRYEKREEADAGPATPPVE